jgi:chromate reductase
VSSPVKSDPAWTDGLKPFEGKVVGLLSASPGALGGLRSLSHLSPMLLNLQCWLTPKQFALSRANEAFDPEGQLFAESARLGVRGVVEQAIWAGQRLSA